jgi:Xanthine and CO dehydrogenases maturation factor, XdhC/CoxF family
MLSRQPLDIQVIKQALVWSAQQPVWLCTVINTWGSSPRHPGALLVANGEQQWCGSLSGGCVEEAFLRQLKEGACRQASQMVTYGEGGLTPDIPLPCGGRLTVLVEYLPATEQTQRYLRRILNALEGHMPLKKRLTLPEPCHELTQPEEGNHPRTEYTAPYVTVWHTAPPRLVVAGYSPVAQYCIDYALSLGFEVVLCEPRPEFLEQLHGTLPESVRLVEQLPARYLEKEGCHAHTAIVALTHDARMDDLTLMEAVLTPAFYIGAMGSVSNSQARLLRLQRVAGLTSAELARIHAPIGLPLGSKTPAEIALAVMADIVMCKNGQVAEAGRDRPARQDAPPAAEAARVPAAISHPHPPITL